MRYLLVPILCLSLTGCPSSSDSGEEPVPVAPGVHYPVIWHVVKFTHNGNPGAPLYVGTTLTQTAVDRWAGSLTVPWGTVTWNQINNSVQAGAAGAGIDCWVSETGGTGGTGQLYLDPRNGSGFVQASITTAAPAPIAPPSPVGIN